MEWGEDDLSGVGRMLSDCKDYMRVFQSIHVQHTLREANGVAYRLAYLARVGFMHDTWIGETPVIIQDVLYEDISHAIHVARGSGFMSSPAHSTININEK